MQLRNDETRFGLISIALHWIGALSVLGMLWTAALIWLATDEEAAVAQIRLHVSLGTLLYGVIAARVLWSLFEHRPASLGTGKLERAAARGTHALLLLLVAAQLLTGPFGVWSGGWPVSAFGLFTIPSPYADPQAWHEAIGELHEACGLAILLLVGLHIAAALKHQFVDGDGTFARMFGIARGNDAAGDV